MGGLLHLVQRGGAWAGCGPAQSPPLCTKCNSSPINGQCTNFILFDVALYLPVDSKGRVKPLGARQMHDRNSSSSVVSGTSALDGLVDLPPHKVLVAALRDGDVFLFVCLFDMFVFLVCLAPKTST